MNATLEMDGIPELQAALKRAGVEAQRRVGDAVNATGLELRGDVVKRIQRGPATGVTYERNGISHQASAPGESPATDTGRLANSVIFRSLGSLTASVGSSLVYAAALEFGTSRIDPRPAWVPAIEKMRPKYIKRLERALGESFA